MRTATIVLLLGALMTAACGGGAQPSPVPAKPASADATGAVTSAAPAATPAGVAFQVPPTKLRAAFSVLTGGVAPLWLALDEGLWQQHGLDVDLTLISGTPVA